MVNLQVGQRVRVRQPEPEWRNIEPQFIGRMDRFVGQVFEVAHIRVRTQGDKRIYLSGEDGVDNYQWRPEWLELATNPIRNGDLL